MVRRGALVALVYGAAFLVQSTGLLASASVGAGPNLMVCAFLLLSLYGMTRAAWAGAVLTGLLWDLCLGPYLGVAALAFFLVGMMLDALAESLNPRSALAVGVTAIWVTASYEGARALLYTLFGRGPSLPSLLWTLPMELLVTAAFSLMFWRVTRPWLDS